MVTGKHCAIFQQINSEKYTLEEKAEAIKEVCGMATHNHITKDRMLDVIRWLLELLFITDIKAERSNADRIRSMTDEELAHFLNTFNVCDNRTHEECTISYCAVCSVCVSDWLKEPAKEEST